MDDCKLSYQDSEVNDEFINTLRDEYESVFEYGSVKMKVRTLKVNKYLGMTLDNSVKVQVKTTMLDYIKEILECLENVEQKPSGTKSSAAPLNLFVSYEDCDKLSK